MLTIVTALAEVSFSTVLAVLIFGLLGERAGMVLWRRIDAQLKALPPVPHPAGGTSVDEVPPARVA